MTKWLMAVGIILLGGALVVPDAEARRIGGGRSVGTQRNVTAPPAQTAAKPAQQAAPAQQGQQGSRWLPLLGGLALGGMLGYLFGGSGLFGFLLLALLAIGAVFAVRALMRRRAEAPQPMQYAGMRETVDVTPGGTSSPVPAEKIRVPAGFDTPGFLRGAKMNFLRLQAANDTGRLDEIRELTTTELYEELKKDTHGRSPT
jgi:predicted lipid-binding transport protein (Tim44 family)